jgi:hypothetical protein
MLRSNRYPLILILAVALMGITFLGPTAGPAQAADLVVNVSGQVTSTPGAFPFLVTLTVGAHAKGSATALSGFVFDNAIGNPLDEHDYCLAPVTGSLSGSVVTLTGVTTFSNNPTLFGVPVRLVADAATGSIEYDFGPFVFTGTGQVVIAPH